MCEMLSDALRSGPLPPGAVPGDAAGEHIYLKPTQAQAGKGLSISGVREMLYSGDKHYVL